MAKINVDAAGELRPQTTNGERVGMFTGVVDDEQIDDFIDDAINS
ncbi:hypothetical protein OESDEN_14997 [Oesophagostomum dentatum]|uniref:Uncharacterized protein n=1 Tax=Oesophagostomum dentatum TaxID=61180 RepID=A0A0B1SQ11_OESDE|nr:hypothetical protein OESDEN_14997 [Oesophagostomum dentatum]